MLVWPTIRSTSLPRSTTTKHGMASTPNLAASSRILVDVDPLDVVAVAGKGIDRRLHLPARAAPIGVERPAERGSRFRTRGRSLGAGQACRRRDQHGRRPEEQAVQNRLNTFDDRTFALRFLLKNGEWSVTTGGGDRESGRQERRAVRYLKTIVLFLPSPSLLLSPSPSLPSPRPTA